MQLTEDLLIAGVLIGGIIIGVRLHSFLSPAPDAKPITILLTNISWFHLDLSEEEPTNLASGIHWVTSGTTNSWIPGHRPSVLFTNAQDIAQFMQWKRDQGFQGVPDITNGIPAGSFVELFEEDAIAFREWRKTNETQPTSPRLRHAAK